MSKFKKEDFAHVGAGLIQRIEGIILDRKFGRLSSSAIYKAHNELFKLHEPIQTCASCLVIRGDKLAKWYEWQARTAAGEATDLEAATVPPSDPVIEPVSLASVAAKYGVEFSDDEEFNVLTIQRLLGSALDLTTEERAVLEARIAPKAVTGGAPDSMPVAEILLQKINKDDYSVTEGEAFFARFTPNADDATKGTVVQVETGKAPQAGTYATSDTTQVLSVQPGGKASYKAVGA